MKLIRSGLRIIEAIELSKKLALETGKVHSVRLSPRAKPPITRKFYVVEGMVGSELAARYTAWPPKEGAA